MQPLNRMAARRPAESPARGLGPFIVKTQDLEKLGELGRGAFGVVVGGKLKIAAKVSRTRLIGIEFTSPSRLRAFDLSVGPLSTQYQAISP